MMRTPLQQFAYLSRQAIAFSGLLRLLYLNKPAKRCIILDENHQE